MSENKDNKFAAFFNTLSEDVKNTFKGLITENKSENFENAPAQPSYTEVPLLDGTVIKVTALEVGGDVLVVTPDGELPAAEGELVLADNSILVIKKEGEKSVIAEIKPATEMKKEDKKLDDTAAKFDAIKSEFAALKEESQKANKELKAELEVVKLKLSQKSAQLKKTIDVLEAFASIPTATPIKTPTVKQDKKDDMFKTIFVKK